ncbi:MAG: SPOR domain-containing protein [Bacteroidaceae bacterium]|jgi:cell division protein FtsN|nr:SPOR domain-containing protein [Bacteroidaceae bacterium]MBO7347678.1 SPOR domain-containing protein [Bacteroidaceae bacterium]MBQ2073143.1 SPOR domain-containing protein [Bacteroidaceae bacterium]
MKKTILMGAALVAAVAMTSCKGNESAYKKAYEKAQEQATVQTPAQTTAPVATTPVTTTPVATTPATPVDNNVSVRTENVSLVNGTGLKAYSVVVGSFGVQANAEALQKILKSEGNDAQIVKSPSNMYRVIFSTHDDKASAAESRNKVRARFADSWLLYNK